MTEPGSQPVPTTRPDGAARRSASVLADGPVRRSAGVLADGRAIVYFDDRADAPERDVADKRDLPAFAPRSELRFDPLLDTWVVVAAHRQSRSYRPPAGDCPLCPSRPGHPSEIPDSTYDVVVFDNRFPALAPESVMRNVGSDDGLLAVRPGYGRCEVVCFTEDHDASFVDLTAQRVGTVLTAWTDRTAALAAAPGTVQVYCFENRGEEIGVTLAHPHGQIYAYPHVTARTAQVQRSVAAHRARTGRNLFDDVVTAETVDGRRMVVSNDSWLAFVPKAARWPYEVHLYPRRRVPDLTGLDAGARADFTPAYLELLARFDGLFGERIPYVSAWHQAPAGPGHDDFALHLELFTVRRAPGRLKYLAGTESGMDAFSNDVLPEVAASRLRAVER
jgi:UDPglucose--hexose-1-phosphate uridylyltransferase